MAETDKDKKKTIKKEVKTVAKKATKKSTAKSVAKSVAKKTVTKKAAPKTSKKSKKTLVEQYRTHKGDTGSTKVQIAQLSEQIDTLAKHLKKHQKDQDSRRGLLIMVGKRRRLLNYLARSDEKTYKGFIKDLKLRK